MLNSKSPGMGKLDKLLLLGDPRLYQVCDPVVKEDLPLVSVWVDDLARVMEGIREQYGFGRAIAAPQIGVMKRLIYLDLDRPKIIINPQLSEKSPEMMELWDDCMSLPNLLVRVKRHRKLKLSYRDEQWRERHELLEGDFSELIQHEYDHLDGILITMRALDTKSFRWRAN